MAEKIRQASAELQEELSNRTLQITGQIPSWLSGTLLRNGPINVAVNGQSNEHWFDGLAMLHAFSFHEGKVTYTNKFLRTNAYSKVFEEGSLKYDGFAVDPCHALFKQLFTWFVPNSKPYLHNADINIAKLADEYVALTETPLPVRFDPKTLETLGVLDYQDELPKNRCWESAHPHYNPHRKETINYIVQYGFQSYYTLYRIADGSTHREMIASIPVSEPSYMHSFSLTENYAIFTEYPFVVRPFDVMTMRRPFIKNYTWKQDRGTVFIVVDRRNGQVVGRYATDPFYAFHHANAYEEGNQIHLDIACYDNADIVWGLAEYFRSIEADKATLKSPSRLERYILNLNSGGITSEILLNFPVEFPRINVAYDGLPYRYLYLADARGAVSEKDLRPIYKMDTSTREVKRWSEKECYPGEPVFVPTPGAKSEDEGVVLTLVLDYQNYSSFLLVLDAQSFKEIGRAAVSHAIPPGLHGQYYNI